VKAFPIAVLIVLAAATAQGQTPSDLQIELRPYYVSENGGERAGDISFNIVRPVIDRMTPSTFSVGDTCEAFTVSSGRELRENATVAWNIEVTPTRVVGDAVTFRLRWARFSALKQQLDQIPLDGTKTFRVPNEDLELTLRPGQSFPVDTIKTSSDAKTWDGRSCRGTSATIRASVDAYPSANVDRRLVAADLWLVERLANGSEAQRSQMLSVRGLPNRPFPFYFDSVPEGKASLDIYGRLTVRPGSGAMAVVVETRSRDGDRGPFRSTTSPTEMKPDETVEIRLPKFGDDAGAFAKREFAIKIRARQLR
jgi:hypothetical protein